jgi:hypothetical protein
MNIVPDIDVGTGAGGIGTAVIEAAVMESGDYLPDPRQFRLPLITNANSPLEHRLVDLAAGDNEVIIQALAGVMIIIPPDDNEEDLELRAALGVSGIPVCHIGAPIIIPFRATPPTVLYLNAEAAIVGVQIIFY